MQQPVERGHGPPVERDVEGPQKEPLDDVRLAEGLGGPNPLVQGQLGRRLPPDGSHLLGEPLGFRGELLERGTS